MNFVLVYVVSKMFIHNVSGAVCPPAPVVANAQRTIVSGDLTSYASIIKYDCNAGYEIVGEPILFCQSNNQWSAATPTCRSKYLIWRLLKNQFSFASLITLEI